MSGRHSIEIADPFARQLLARYLERRVAEVRNLRAALERSDFETIRVTGHNLMGSGAAYGLEKISELGQKIETAAVAQDADGMDTLLRELQAFLDTVGVR